MLQSRKTKMARFLAFSNKISTVQKIVLSSSRGQGNFRGPKAKAKDLRLRGQGLQNVSSMPRTSSRTPPLPRTSASLITCNKLSLEGVYLCFVPVKVQRDGKTVLTYAFLDQESTHTALATPMRRTVPTYRTRSITKKAYRTSVPYFLAKIEGYRTYVPYRTAILAWL